MTSNYFGVKSNIFAEDEKERFNYGSNFLKLENREKPYSLRLCPAWNNEGTPFRKSITHSAGYKQMFQIKKDDGSDKNIQPVCLAYIFSEKNFSLAKYLITAGKITAEDYEAFKSDGCPNCKVAKAMREEIQKIGDELMPKPRYFWNMINRDDEKLYVYTSSQKFTASVQAAYQSSLEDDIDIFSPENGRDFLLKVTGSGDNKRYGDPQFKMKTSPLGYKGELIDLNGILAMGVYPYKKMVEALHNNTRTMGIIRDLDLEL